MKIFPFDLFKNSKNSMFPSLVRIAEKRNPLPRRILNLKILKRTNEREQTSVRPSVRSVGRYMNKCPFVVNLSEISETEYYGFGKIYCARSLASEISPKSTTQHGNIVLHQLKPNNNSNDSQTLD